MSFVVLSPREFPVYQQFIIDFWTKPLAARISSWSYSHPGSPLQFAIDRFLFFPRNVQEDITRRVCPHFFSDRCSVLETASIGSPRSLPDSPMSTFSVGSESPRGMHLEEKDGDGSGEAAGGGGSAERELAELAARVASSVIPPQAPPRTPLSEEDYYGLCCIFPSGVHIHPLDWLSPYRKIPNFGKRKAFIEQIWGVWGEVAKFS